MPIRRLYFLAAATTFLVALPLVYAYTAGVRFSTLAGRTVQRGALVVESKPPGAHIRINGQDIPERTPLRAPALSPGRYTVELTREGFSPWSKRLTVEPGRATLALSVTLLRIPPRLTLLGAPPAWASLDPTGHSLLTWNAGRLGILRPTNRLIEDLGFAAQPTQVRWETRGRRAIVRSAEGLSLLIVGAPSVLLPLPTATAATFDPLDRQAVLLSGADGIEQYSPQSHTQTLLWKTEAAAVEAVGSTVAWRTQAGGVALGKRSVAGTPASAPIPLTVSGAGDPRAAVDQLYLATFEGVSIVRGVVVHPLVPLPSVVAIVSAPNGRSIALFGAQEVWVASPVNGQRELLWRSAKHVSGVSWVGNDAIAVLADDGIRVVELDGRDTRNAPVVYSGTGARLLGTDAAGRLLIAQPESPGQAPALLALTIT